MESSIPKYFDTVYSKAKSSLSQSLLPNNKQRRLIKGKGSSQIFEISSSKSSIYLSSTISDLPPGLILDELKNWTNFNLWFQWINRITPLTKWNDYCEMIEMSFQIPYLSLLGLNRSYQLLFYWSFSPEDKCYYMLYKPLNTSLHLMKYGAFIINVAPGLGVKNNVLSATCIISTFIKFNKSFSPFNYISQLYGVELCSSIENFLGLVEMKKHFSSSTKSQAESYADSDKSLSQYQYLISFFNNENATKPKARKVSFDPNHLNQSQFVTVNSKVACAIDDKNLVQLKAFLEVKNAVKDLFNAGYYKDKDLVRFVIAYQGNVDMIMSVLEDFAHFRKNNSDFSETNAFKLRKGHYTNEVFYLMKDVLNRPVIQVNVASLLSNEQYEFKSFSAFLMLFLDDLFERIDQGVDRIALIINLHNFTMENISKSKLSQMINDFDELMKLLLRFYVERLGEAYFINVNDAFGSLWTSIEKSMSVIQKKVVICHNIRQDLRSILTDEQINELLI